MYERLTDKRIGHGGFIEYKNYDKFGKLPNEREIYDRLCELEDKIEQGKIVELPCAIGETVYHITTCEEFKHELDGNLYDMFGGFGDATGYYCPCELRDNCPFDNEEDFDCDTLKKKQAVFVDEVKGIFVEEYDTWVYLEYSGNVCASEFGKTVFLTPEEANKKLKELEGE